MSYLLEALKRLEQKRQLESVGDLLVGQDNSSRPRRKRTVWPYILSVALLVNAAVVAWLWQPTRQPAASTVIERSREPGTRTAGTTAPPKTMPGDGQLAGTSDEGAGVKTPLPHVTVPSGNTPSDVQDKAPLKVTARSGVEAAARTSASRSERMDTATPVHKSRADVPPGGRPARVPSLDELPGTVREAMPKLKVSLHSFAPEPSSRLIRINDSTLVEGKSLPAGIRVEEITQDGAVMSHQGYLFHLPVK